jgi:pimeloyl-ACP methyl ester carboxylesterase
MVDAVAGALSAVPAVVFALVLLALLNATLMEQQRRMRLQPLKSLPSVGSGRLVTVQGQDVHVVESGKRHHASMPLVVLECGTGLTVMQWQHVQRDISVHTACLSYDRPGLGLSRVAPGDVDVLSRAISLRHLLQALGHAATPLVLVAHSTGASNVQMYAAMYPEFVRGVVLVDPVCGAVSGRVDAATATTVAGVPLPSPATVASLAWRRWRDRARLSLLCTLVHLRWFLSPRHALASVGLAAHSGNDTTHRIAASLGRCGTSQTARRLIRALTVRERSLLLHQKTELAEVALAGLNADCVARVRSAVAALRSVPLSVVSSTLPCGGVPASLPSTTCAVAPAVSGWSSDTPSTVAHDRSALGDKSVAAAVATIAQHRQLCAAYASASHVVVPACTTLSVLVDVDGVQAITSAARSFLLHAP